MGSSTVFRQSNSWLALHIMSGCAKSKYIRVLVVMNGDQHKTNTTVKAKRVLATFL